MFPFKHIILASKSPRRKQLLKQIGINFSIEISGIDETMELNLSPHHIAENLSKEKARKVSQKFPEELVVGADTLVVYKKQILGKPKNDTESFDMLSMLSGKTHKVITGVSLQCINKNINTTFHETTKVTFHTLSNSYISYYINTYNPYDKAGSYGIQDWFAVCVKKIDGCFYNVMGLPLAKFWKEITELR